MTDINLALDRLRKPSSAPEIEIVHARLKNVVCIIMSTLGFDISNISVCHSLLDDLFKVTPKATSIYVYADSCGQPRHKKNSPEMHATNQLIAKYLSPFNFKYLAMSDIEIRNEVKENFDCEISRVENKKAARQEKLQQRKAMLAKIKSKLSTEELKFLRII